MLNILPIKLSSAHTLAAFMIVGTLLPACTTSGNKSEKDPKAKLISRIDTLEGKTYEDAFRSSPDLNLLHRLSELYDSFSTSFPDDTLSPEYLFKAGQLAENAFADNSKAVIYYSGIYEKYTSWKKREFMLFALGNAYHNLSDTTKAIELLTRFNRQNPSHEFADDALSLIKFIRMSKEEVDSLFKSTSDIP